MGEERGVVRRETLKKWLNQIGTEPEVEERTGEPEGPGPVAVGSRGNSPRGGRQVVATQHCGSEPPTKGFPALERDELTMRQVRKPKREPPATMPRARATNAIRPATGTKRERHDVFLKQVRVKSGPLQPLLAPALPHARRGARRARDGKPISAPSRPTDSQAMV